MEVPTCRQSVVCRSWLCCYLLRERHHFSSAPVVRSQQTAAAPASGKTWLGRRQALEDYLRTAEVIKMEDIGLGVTKPRRAYLAPGGLVDRMAWKAIRPGIHQGFWESYKSEIVAYELDKVLGLDMIPPTVERQVKGEVRRRGHVDFAGEKLQGSWRSALRPSAKLAAWSRQLIRAKMFDNLIATSIPTSETGSSIRRGTSS